MSLYGVQVHRNGASCAMGLRGGGGQAVLERARCAWEQVSRLDAGEES